MKRIKEDFFSQENQKTHISSFCKKNRQGIIVLRIKQSVEDRYFSRFCKSKFLPHMIRSTLIRERFWFHIEQGSLSEGSDVA